jgi:hypothetical protein
MSHSKYPEGTWEFKALDEFAPKSPNIASKKPQ